MRSMIVEDVFSLPFCGLWLRLSYSGSARLNFLKFSKRDVYFDFNVSWKLIKTYIKCEDFFWLHFDPLSGNFLLIHIEFHWKMPHNVVGQIIAFHFDDGLQFLLSVVFCLFDVHRDSSAHWLLALFSDLQLVV